MHLRPRHTIPTAGYVTLGSGATLSALFINLTQSPVATPGGTLQFTGATANASHGLQVDVTGLLAGYGTINGNVTNLGTFQVSGGAPINGNYTQVVSSYKGQPVTPVLEIDLYEDSSGRWSSGLLTVSNQATLAGQFTSAANTADAPPVGTVFTLLSYGSRGGSFDSVVVPSYSDRALQAWYDSQQPNTFGLQVVPSGGGQADIRTQLHRAGHTSHVPHIPASRRY